MSTDHERQKWDDYYASLPAADEDEHTRQFRAEFVALVKKLLPSGGRVLEAGCGTGQQSLALAQNGFDVTLLDFSSVALAQARQLFAHANLTAEFVLEDAFQSGAAEFDLVFNAGVLEHYNFEQQVALVRAMSSRSRKYVLALVPNAQNYWYWLWRAHKSSQNLWPFGKEIPTHDLRRVFKTADLNFLGNAHLGASWTESFIEGVAGIAPELKSLLIDTHRAGIVPAAQTSYLVAGLGAVADATVSLSEWGAPAQVHSTSSESESLTAALADALAMQIEARRATDSQRADFLAQIDELREQLRRLEQRNTQALLRRVQEIERQSAAELALTVHQLEAEFTQRARELEESNAAQLAETLEKLEHRKDAAIAEILAELESQNEAALIETIKQLEYQQVFDYTGLVRQMEHDHTGVLVGKNLEIVHLRGQLDALRPPLMPGRSANIRAMGRRVIIRLGLLPVLKRIRHHFRKQVHPVVNVSEISYQPPYQLGHPEIQPERRVVILTYTFFDFDGNVLYAGGAERYVLEMADLIRELGYFPEVYQCGNGYWVRYYRDLRVTGIDVGDDAARLPEAYSRLPHAAVLTIFSPFSLAVPVEGAALGISHGVFWDYSDFQANLPAMQTVLHACRHLDTVVSVDTNTINWVRANAAGLAEKFVYVPNFVDVDVFTPSPQLPSPNGRGAGGEGLVILYPRRLYRPRGFWLVAEILPEILKAYPLVEFYFVGQADPPEAAHVETLMAQFPGRVRWEALPPEDMPAVYQQAQIALIPTVHSEGTSLSCLEALAAGVAVIATDVGGLPNLVIHRYNGLLIEPTAPALARGLRELLANPALRAELGARGREVAQSFSLERWRAVWLNLLRGKLPDLNEAAPRLPVAYFPTAPGIAWEGIKQRPHQIALQLAKAGIETFWGDPERRADSPHPLLHILGPNDEVCLRGAAVVVYYPHHYPRLADYDQPFVVYDVLDDISIHAESDRVQGLPSGQRAVDYHQSLLVEADLVITSSEVLQRRIQPQRPDVRLIPNGVDLAHFTPAPPPANPAPVIGFHGAVAAWFDLDLLAEVARLRPGYQFRLIGPASISLATLTRLSNVTHRQTVPYEKITNQVARFDVGILPFKLTDLTHAVRPLKVLEYLAMGVPVVATSLEELCDWPGVILADLPEDFAVAIDQALLSENGLRNDEQVRIFVEAADWEQVTRPLVEALKQ